MHAKRSATVSLHGPSLQRTRFQSSFSGRPIIFDERRSLIPISGFQFFTMTTLWEYPSILDHTQRLLNSFQHWFGYGLLEPMSSMEDVAQQVFLAPFALLSHGTEPDPVLNYGNQTALNLWQMDWDEFTRMPSRLTAEPDLRDVRSQLLAQVTVQGYLRGYSGVRIAKTGQRFLIEDVMIWKVLNQDESVCGQAAMFKTWKLVS